MDQLQIKYGKIRSDISGELRLENNYHNKFKNQFNFWDVTFYLCTGEYQLYKKPNNTPTYINVNSNHRPNIIKALPDNISKRINNISSDKGTFNNAAPSYNDVLSASGYKDNLTYQQDLTPSKKVRQRKIIWFNPPYSMNVETNIGKTFLKLIDKHFQKPTSSTKYSTETMPKLATVVYLILPT